MIEGISFADYVDSINPEALFADGFDDCVIGVCEVFGRPPLVAYDKKKMIDKMVEEGMTILEAEEYFDYNIVGSWVGENTPVFVTRVDET